MTAARLVGWQGELVTQTAEALHVNRATAKALLLHADYDIARVRTTLKETWSTPGPARERLLADAKCPPQRGDAPGKPRDRAGTRERSLRLRVRTGMSEWQAVSRHLSVTSSHPRGRWFAPRRRAATAGSGALDGCAVEEVECLVCMEDCAPEDISACPAGHQFCNACWAGHIQAQVSEGAPGAFSFSLAPPRPPSPPAMRCWAARHGGLYIFIYTCTLRRFDVGALRGVAPPTPLGCPSLSARGPSARRRRRPATGRRSARAPAAAPVLRPAAPSRRELERYRKHSTQHTKHAARLISCAPVYEDTNLRWLGKLP